MNEPKENEHETVEITIDGKERQSLRKTTGKVLYVLGEVDPKKYDLFRETRGKGDDELINDDETPVHVKEGDQFFSLKKKLNPGK